MRQAVVNFGVDAIGELGFEVFTDAGILAADVLSCEGPRGVVRLRVEEELDEQRLDESDVVEWWERVSDEGPGYVYLVEADTNESVEPTDPGEDRHPLVEGIEVNGREVTLTYSDSQDRISNEIAALRAAGTDVTLEALRSYRVEGTGLDALTERQREVVEVAFDRGYYDAPRTVTTKELADVLGLDDSTVSEHLRRGERNLISSVLGRSP